MRLIGREAELDDLTQRCTTHRLVTVVGPGGVGKTALAHAAAAQLSGRFPHGSHVVDLSAVSEPGRVAAELAAQLGFATVDALLSSPVDLPVLLVVDSCEHVLDAAAEAVAALLASCDAPTVLATSRSPLDLPGESVLVLGPLAVARDAGEPSAATDLFLARARDAGAALAPEDRPGIDLLCRALDGLPLAIEIAAARARLLGPAELLRTLDVDSLLRPRFRGAERHRSVRAAIEWSYRLLDARERELFDRLGVISGEFLPEGADAVSAPGEPVLEQVEALVAASLLVTERRSGVTWLRQLDTVRAFAGARLRESGRWESTWERFVDHVVTRVRPGAGEPAVGRWETAALSRLVERHARVLETLRWAAEHDEDPRRPLVLQGALWQTLHLGRLDDAHAVCEQVLARWGAERTPAWADAAVTAAACRFLVGDPQGAAELATEVLENGGSSPLGTIALHCVLGQCASLEGHFDAARAHFAAGADAAGTGTLGVEMRAFAAAVAVGEGRFEEALAELDEARRDANPAADRLTVWIDTLAGHALLGLDHGLAFDRARTTLLAAQAADFPACEVANLHTMAVVALGRQREAEAAGWCVDALERLALRGAVSETRPVLRLAAGILEHRGHPGWRDLGATVAAMPSSSLLDLPGAAAGPTADIGADPAPGARVLARGAAIQLARRSLGAVPVPDGSPSPPHPARLVRTGEGWEASFAGRTVVLRASKGLDDLALLLVRQGEEVPSIELVGAGVEQPDTGEVIDARARAAYEQRIRDLHETLEDARDAHDLGRVEAARVELDALVDHLSAAVGLRGTRRAGGNAERARSTVTQRLRATVRRLAVVHPELGRHLEVSLVTGSYCCYRPERPVAWVVDVGRHVV